MKKVKTFLIASVFALAGLVGQNVYAQGSMDDLPGAGITPNNPLFFLDRMGESIRSMFTFGVEDNAKLQLEFAAERISEVRAMLEDKGVESRGIEVARQRMEGHLSRAVGILDDERNRGKDVNQLTVNINAEMGNRREALRRVFEERIDALKAQEQDLQRRRSEAQAAGNETLARELQAQRDVVKAQRQALNNERSRQEGILDTQRGRMEDRLGDNLQAQERINKADFERQRLSDRISSRGLVVSQAELQRLDAMLQQAKAAFARGSFAEAESLARQADIGFEFLREGINDDFDLNEDRNIDEFEIRGRQNEAEIRGRENEAEVRGRENEAEIRGRENEAEVRGRENEAEVRGGVDDSGRDGVGDNDASGRGGSGGGSTDD